jgi:hypothetical protein
MDIDRRALARGNVRFCGTNTGQDLPVGSGGDNHWGEVYCITDGALTRPPPTTAFQTLGGITYTLLASSTPEYQPLAIGSFDFAMMDNVAYSTPARKLDPARRRRRPSFPSRREQRPVGLPRRRRR